MKIKINKYAISSVLEEMTKENPIHLNPEHKGEFTKWCRQQGFSGVNCECIKEGLKAGGNRARQANFARNFGHKECK